MNLRPRLAARFVFVAVVLAGAALAGCELAVHPDLELAEVPVQPCEVCLSDADTVITEPDGNVLIVPTDTLDASDAEVLADQ